MDSKDGVSGWLGRSQLTIGEGLSGCCWVSQSMVGEESVDSGGGSEW